MMALSAAGPLQTLCMLQNPRRGTLVPYSYGLVGLPWITLESSNGMNHDTSPFLYL